MIDVHSHLIPAIDDGSCSIEETVQMIKEAEDAGFTDIVLTSHYLINYYETEANIINVWTEQLQNILDQKNINVKIYSGNEVYITENLDELIKNNIVCTMANSHYLLMELPMSSNVKYLDNIIFTLKTMKIVPIIAHPERYKFIQEDPDRIEDLIEQGCLIQCNYASITGFYGKEALKTVKQLLKNDHVHLLGSDCHKPNTIYKDMKNILKKLNKIISDEQLHRITVKNPSIILKNEDF